MNNGRNSNNFLTEREVDMIPFIRMFAIWICIPLPLIIERTWYTGTYLGPRLEIRITEEQGKCS